MKRKLLIIGGSGFIGGNIAKISQKQGWDTYIAGRSNKLGFDSAMWMDIDITDEESIRSVISRVGPDAVINTAAIANIDVAEEQKEVAWKVNTGGAYLASKICCESGAKYIFLSSDAVFDGEGLTYSENDAVSPVNYYGYTKAEAEKAVISVNSEAIVIRISLVLGFSANNGVSFLSWLEEKLKEGSEIICPKAEVRTPIDVITLSECIMELAESNFSGIIHIGSTDSLDRLSLTKKIARVMGYNEDLIKADTDGKIVRKAPRHKNGIINVEKAKSILKTPLLCIDDEINKILGERLG